jgi:hypothetical protein
VRLVVDRSLASDNNAVRFWHATRVEKSSHRACILDRQCGRSLPKKTQASPRGCRASRIRTQPPRAPCHMP